MFKKTKDDFFCSVIASHTVPEQTVIGNVGAYIKILSSRKNTMQLANEELLGLVSGGTGTSSIVGDDSGRGCTEIGMGIPF